MKLHTNSSALKVYMLDMKHGVKATQLRPGSNYSIAQGEGPLYNGARSSTTSRRGVVYKHSSSNVLPQGQGNKDMEHQCTLIIQLIIACMIMRYLHLGNRTSRTVKVYLLSIFTISKIYLARNNLKFRSPLLVAIHQLFNAGWLPKCNKNDLGTCLRK